MIELGKDGGFCQGSAVRRACDKLRSPCTSRDLNSVPNCPRKEVLLFVPLLLVSLRMAGTIKPCWATRPLLHLFPPPPCPPSFLSTSRRPRTNPPARSLVPSGPPSLSLLTRPGKGLLPHSPPTLTISSRRLVPSQTALSLSRASLLTKTSFVPSAPRIRAPSPSALLAMVDSRTTSTWGTR